MNVDLVCQSTPKEPLWTRVSRGAVATVITACGFVTGAACGLTTCSSARVATVITACGFVTGCRRYGCRRGIRRCNSDYRLRFCNSARAAARLLRLRGCNSDYRLRFCNRNAQTTDAPGQRVATVITACGFVTWRTCVSMFF